MANISSTKVTTTVSVFRVEVRILSITIIDPIAFVTDPVIQQEILARAGLSSSLIFLSARTLRSGFVGSNRFWDVEVSYDTTPVSATGHQHDSSTLSHPLQESYVDGATISIDAGSGPVVVSGDGTTEMLTVKDESGNLFRVPADGNLRIGKHVRWEGDNQFDIGTSDAGASLRRPRDVYVGRDVKATKLDATLAETARYAFKQQPTNPSLDSASRHLYWNQTDNSFRVWDGTTDVSLPALISGDVTFVVDNISALINVDTSVNNTAAILGYNSRDDGGVGFFYFDPSDLQTEVTADPEQGIFVAPATDPTGASGAWTRLVSNGVVNVKWFGARADGSTDDTDAIRAANTAAANKVLYIPHSTLSYRTDRIELNADTNYFLEPGVHLECTVAGIGVLMSDDKDNIHISGYGAKVSMAGQAGGSSTVKIGGGNNIVIEGLHMDNGGAAKDALQLALGTSDQSATNVTVRNCIISNGPRNCLSIIAGKHVTIEKCEIFGAVTSPGAGIDIEANQYSNNQHITIVNNNIHDNTKFGIINSFGSDVLISGNRLDNNNIGISIGNGGEVIQNGSFHDIRRPISAFNLSTGGITINNAANDPFGNQDIVAGQLGQFININSTTKPTEFQAQVRWVVDDVSGPEIFLSQHEDVGQVTSLSDAGDATLSSDPEVAEIFWFPYYEKQASNYTIVDNVVTGNTVDNISISAGSINTIVARNRIIAEQDVVGLKVSFNQSTEVSGNILMGDVTASGAGVLNSGLSCSVVSECRINDNYFHGFTGGLNISSVSGRTINIGEVVNCGGANGTIIEVSNSTRLTIDGLTMSSDTAQATTLGLNFLTSVTDSHVTNTHAEGVGSSDVNSIKVRSENLLTNSWMRSGLFTGPINRFNGAPIDGNPAAGALSADISPASGSPGLFIFNGSVWLPFANLP